MTEAPTISSISPQLPVAEIGRSVDWYARALGFAAIYRDADFAILKRDGLTLHLWRCENAEIARWSSAYLHSPDVDALHATMLGAIDGGRIKAPENRDWGMREFYIWDPDGNLLKFGQDLKAR